MASSQIPMLALSRRPNDPLAPAPADTTNSRPLSDAATVATSNSSLAANYLPTKFTGPRKRVKAEKEKARERERVEMRKEGGGREAFGRDEARMPGVSDEDYDGVEDVNINLFKHGRRTRTLRWNKFKWTLLLANVVLSTYSFLTLIFCILTWLNVFAHADVVRVGNRPELVVSTVAAVVGVLTSLVGWAGILLNNRGFLAVYTFLLWVVFALSVAPGYMTYKKHTFNLEGKVCLFFPFLSAHLIFIGRTIR